MKNNYIDSVFNRVSAENANRANTDEFLRDTLIKMQTDKGISQETAQVAADDCILAVLTYNKVVEDAKNDASGTMREFLSSLSQLNDEDRLMILNQIDFGLKVGRKSSLLKELNEDADMSESVFEKESMSEDIEKTEASILNRVMQYGISKDTVELFTKEVKKKGNYYVCIEDFTRNDFYIKSLATMETYLQSESEKTMLAAAGEACTSVEVQAVADAVNQGVINKEKAKKIIIALAVAAIVIAVIAAIVLAIQTNNYQLLVEGSKQAVDVAYAQLSALPYAETNLIRQAINGSFLKTMSVLGAGIKKYTLSCIISALVAGAGGTAIHFSDKISDFISRRNFNKATEDRKFDSFASGMHAIAEASSSETEYTYVEQADSASAETDDEKADEYNINRSANFEFA